MVILKSWSDDYEKKLSELANLKNQFNEAFPQDIKEVLANPSYDLQEFFEILKKHDYELLYGNEATLLKLVQSMVEYWHLEDDFIRVNEYWRNALEALSSSIMGDWLDRAFEDDGVQEMVCSVMKGLSSINVSDCPVQDLQNDISDEEMVDFYENFLEQNSDYYVNLLNDVASEMRQRDDEVAVEVQKIIETYRD